MNIENRIILTRKITPLIYIYIMIVVITTLSLIILFMLFNYRIYYDSVGTVIKEEDKYYLKCYIPFDSTKYITNNKTLKLDEKIYKYRISKIEEEYYTDNQNTYQIFVLDLNLDEKDKHNNLVLKLKFLKENKRVIEYLKDLWRYK